MLMSLECRSFVEVLKDRAELLGRSRKFFAERNVIEVDCPMLSKFAPVDQHIDVMRVQLNGGEERFLHTSPEYPMKRLLVEGMGDIYQIGHVFREGEVGRLHNPEFTMVEWYRIGMGFEDLIEETLDYCRLFLGELESEFITYREALKRYAGIDYVGASESDLVGCIRKHEIDTPDDIDSWDRDTLLEMIVSFIVEPHLGKDRLCVLKHYPASQACLSKTAVIEDEKIGYRFEIYYKGMELANGYDELLDPVEQKKRLEEENACRIQMGKEPLPVDPLFLKALEKGMPDSSGVAVGFDRLMLLRHSGEHIRSVIPFHWDNI